MIHKSRKNSEISCFCNLGRDRYIVVFDNKKISAVFFQFLIIKGSVK